MIPIRVLLGLGLVLVSAGLVLLGGLDSDSQWTHFIPGFILAGLGIGMINPPLSTTQVGVVPPQRSGMAAGSGNTFRQVGIATGIATLGAIFQHAVRGQDDRCPGLSPPGGSGNLSAALSSGNVARPPFAALPAAQRQHFVEAFHIGFTGALNEILMIAAVTAFLGAIAGLRWCAAGTSSPQAHRLPDIKRARGRLTSQRQTPFARKGPGGRPPRPDPNVTEELSA